MIEIKSTRPRPVWTTRFVVPLTPSSRSMQQPPCFSMVLRIARASPLRAARRISTLRMLIVAMRGIVDRETRAEYASVRGNGQDTIADTQALRLGYQPRMSGAWFGSSKANVRRWLPRSSPRVPIKEDLVSLAKLPCLPPRSLARLTSERRVDL